MKNMKVKSILALLLVVCSIGIGYAQQMTVKGQVWDEVLNEPLIGVNVTVKGTTNGVITDMDGNFSINVQKNQVLIFSFIGYKDVEIVVKPNLNLSKVVMSESMQQIDEVVVVGYGQQKKASSVGSIATAKGDDLLKVGSVTTVSEALQGQMPGVVAINTSSKPGADAADIFIRGKATWGNASPLVLVDGMERNFNDVDVNEIESISVLKDASATAVYGVKGANGVILVTTKRGKNKKTVVNFSANFGFKQPTTELKWADYPTSMRMYNEAAANDGMWDKIIPESTISAWDHAYATGNYGPYNDYFPQVDWWNEMVGNFGFQQNYNLNISGGTERMAYFASIGMLNDGDIYNTKKQQDFDPRFYYKRYNWRSNFDFKITKSTTLSVNIAGKMGYRNQPGYRDADKGDGYIFDPFIQTPTNLFPIKYSDGEWGADGQGNGNIVAQMNNQGQRHYKSFQGFYDVILKQNLDMITKGLSVKATVSYNTYSDRQSSIFKARIYGANDAQASGDAIIRYHRVYDYANPIVNADGSIDYPLIREERFPTSQMEEDRPIGASHDNFKDYGRKLYYEVALNYQRSFNDHNVTALAVFNRKITEDIDTSDTNRQKMKFASYEEDWVGRVTYNWKERYLAEVNAAYTGSEKFAPGKRFGFFPSFSVGWRVTEEPFMKKIQEKWLTNLKLRYSYGEVGSDKGAPRFNYIQLFESGGNVTFGKNQNVTYGPLYTEGKLAYQNATWETAIKQNLGIEMTILRKLKLNLDLFDERRTGILMERNTVAPWMGTGLPSVNIGETKNHGLELELGWNDKIGKDFSYFAKFNFATSENRIVYKDDPNRLDDYLKAAGKPIGYVRKYLVSGNLSSIDDIFNYTQSGIVNGSQDKLIPGDLAYMDYNGDGVIDAKDTAPVEHLNYPLTTYGLTLGFTYKGFGVNALFYAATGVYKEQIGAFLWDFPQGNIKAQPNTLDRWTPEDALSGDILRPSVHLVNDYNSKENTYSYTNHSYLRLKNLEVNYAFPKEWIKKMNISSCQLYVNGNNLFTISGVDDRRDPETGGGSVYPIVRRYNVGVRLSF
ncbi:MULTISPECIES: SusC/RagA family TonB-linked outer membrane protein [Bacteroides]|jgi:tonB-linked outer membrane protein, susC/ragA family|uniref:SusC/RagA family TonB-linked outer membrane protein n=1 Tax=Bacteroides TaxID=816 RepID=UPI000E857A73|nr:MULTISPECIES: TonB-dependent receptor [Bacteroides]RGD82535.1 TonB-dependent receptor [Bacteroides caccae]RHG51071.1 TonB-dependent receptor [Bacteroides caccae]